MKQAAIGKRNNIKRYTGLLYISPWIIGFLTFQLYPLVASFIYSFTNSNLFRSSSFYGIKNYIYIFTRDADFLTSAKATLLYVIVSVPSKLIFALLIAIILNSRLRLINFFRTLYYLPSILGGSVALAILWRLLFTREGLVNQLLAFANIPPVGWLSNENIAIYTISLLSVWQFGSSMVIFLAGLKQVPDQLYEAGTVDGASRLRKFFSITLPMISPMILFNLIMQTINAFQEFTSAFIVTNGGPAKSTYLYGMKLYQEMFAFYKVGYASALSWVLFIIIICLTGLTFKFSNKWTYYEDGGNNA